MKQDIVSSLIPGLSPSEVFAPSLFKMDTRTIGKRIRSDIIFCHHGFGDAYFLGMDVVCFKNKW
jgi:hypothetical protein